MKKESQNYKARYSKFILLVIFILLMVNRTIAQCTGTDVTGSCSSCMSAIDMTKSCNTSTCYQSPHLTDLQKTGVGPTATVTIHGSDFEGVSSMTVTQIQIYDASCLIVPVDGSPFTSATFPTMIQGAPINITFQNFNDHVVIAIPSGQKINSLLIGYTINFVVNVFVNGSATASSSRNYFFKITNTSFIVGDTHITTVDGAKYDFQAVGEFVVLVAGGGDNLEIQTRQTAVATSGPGTDPGTGLSTCVTVNTAVAARVGTHRVTYQPNINGQPDSSGMQLRVDGKLTELGESAIDLGLGGSVKKSPAGGGAIQIDFPDGTSLIVTPTYWSSYHQWYLNVSVNNTAARMGISGVIPYNDTLRRSRSWLPALPDGSSVGPMPQSLHDRFVTLYQTFADAWRVTDQTSLFDYAPGTTTATFTNKNWPVENGQSCTVAGQTPKAPMGQAAAEQLAIGITNPNLKANAIYDMMLTGDPIFAQTYLLTQKTQTNTTAIRVTGSADTTKSGETVKFTATVARKFSAGTGVLAGSVEFTADGKSLGQVKLEANGLATLTTTSLEVGQHQIAGRFIPDAGSTDFSSSSLEIPHTVIAGGAGSIIHQWWFWLIVLLIIIGIIIAQKRKKKGP